MIEPSPENPFASPAEAQPSPGENQNPSLYIFWSWLALAISFSFAGTPADPISMIFALTLGIVCFSAGCVQSSQWHIGTRVLILAPLLLMASLLLKVLWWPWPWMNAVNI